MRSRGAIARQIRSVWVLATATLAATACDIPGDEEEVSDAQRRALFSSRP